MKKISRLMATVLSLCMAFSTVAFAAETKMPVTETDDAQKYVSETAIEPKAPAPPITSITIFKPKKGDDGNTTIVLEMMGYGDKYGYIDGKATNDYTMVGITRPGSREVIGWTITYNLGKLESGSHTFKFIGRSYNSPWNTMTKEYNFTV